jgi:REP element-mobilizing transposase RayT
MKSDPKIHHRLYASAQGRHSLRLQGYDYSQEGAYFVTIVTQGREALFGEVVNGEMRMNRYGEIVQKWWETIPEHFPNVETGAFGVMPNHVHGIVIIIDTRRGTVPVPRVGNTAQLGGEIPNWAGKTQFAGGETPPLRKPTLGQVIAYFKYQTTKEINKSKGGAVTKIWQRSFYDHILRNQHDLELTWLYIESNPAQWETDNENPAKR